ncbi:hemimethylated DNA binding domain protein [Ancylostoma caninum]|uniref:Hemimethylated DNA binding domain protein n=1 Tax=Ancylostoma caninum TaxID=29170 RepID=A0A368FGU9_ANCCA|nr:hemimethylated DNA binding domain protein [Ancylostoma caninum]
MDVSPIIIVDDKAFFAPQGKHAAWKIGGYLVVERRRFPSSPAILKSFVCTWSFGAKLTDSVIRTAEKIGIRLPFVYIRTGYQEKNAPASNDDDDDAVVDEQERKDSSSYGNSLEVRERAPHVRWRVGQVVKHKVVVLAYVQVAVKNDYFIFTQVHGYRGVIIGWDLTAKASKEFIERVHKGNKEFADKPNYAILIDVRDRLIPQLGYVVQDNIELHGGRIIHNLLNTYMERYDENDQKYVPKPWLKRIYPDD